MPIITRNLCRITSSAARSRRGEGVGDEDNVARNLESGGADLRAISNRFGNHHFWLEV